MLMLNTKKNIERRQTERLPHVSQIKVKSLEGGVYVKGRMFNYNDMGSHFENDILLSPSIEIFILIEVSPFCQSDSKHDFYHALVKHCKELDYSHFRYGCGAQLMHSFGSDFF